MSVTAGTIQVTGLAASSRDQIPLGVVWTLGGSELYPVKNGFGVRRHRDGCAL